MKPDRKTPQQRQAETRMVKVLISGFTGFGGAFSGLIVASIAGSYLEPWLGFRPVWWQGLLVGGAVGWLLGYFQALAILRHSKAYSQTAARLGLERLSDDDTTRVGRELDALHPGQDARFWDCHFRASDDARIVIGDMGLEDSDHWDDDEDREKQQTAFYIEFENLVFPEFRLQPEKLALRVLDRFTGDHEINFADSPRFSKMYFLIGQPGEAVRQLFGKPVRDLLERHKGLTIVGKKNRLVIYRLDHTCPLEELDTFSRQCLAVVSALRETGLEIPVESTKLQPVTRASALQQAEDLGGVVGLLLKRDIKQKAIEVDEVSAFLNQAVPRPVPRQLKRQLRADPFLVLMSCFFGLGGLALLLTGMLATVDAKTRAIMIAAASLILVIFGTVLCLVKMRERHRMRLLTRGRVRTAVIENVAETAFVNGNQRVFRAELRYTDATTGDRTASTRIQGYPATVAQKLSESGAETRVLQDTAAPGRILLVDCYAIQ